MIVISLHHIPSKVKKHRHTTFHSVLVLFLVEHAVE